MGGLGFSHRSGEHDVFKLCLFLEMGLDHD